MIAFLLRHFHVLVFASFWFSLGLYGLVAPPARVALLESGLVTEGWHLSLLALLLGGPVLALYVWRARSSSEASGGSEGAHPVAERV